VTEQFFVMRNKVCGSLWWSDDAQMSESVSN